jgi:putative sterol carrier protein
VDSWAAELNAEIASEKEELLSNPYADEEGEFQLDPEDEDAPEAVEEAAEEPAQADEVDALLEASADAWGDSLQAETEAETAALTAGWDDDEDPAAEEAENAERVAVVLDDETEGPAAEDDVDALLDASADAWGDLLAEETEAEREALLADLGDDEETSPPQGT